MIALPRRLQPWAPELSLLGAHVRTGLGPWLPRLERGLGRLSADRSEPHGEVDGFDGLARKGPYERLLITEWALAEAAPEEFLRRSTVGEHMFLQVARSSPAQSRRWVVLLDGGPAQLGAPRLAHLALLIVAASKARSERADLRWGLLQASGPARKGLEIADLKILGRPGFDRSPTAEDGARWLDACAVTPENAEVWVVGQGSPMVDWARTVGARALEVRCPVSLRRSAELHVEQRHPPTRRVPAVLPLPEPSIALAMLRDPGEQRQRRPPVWSSAPDGVSATLCAKGRHLFVRTEVALEVYRVPEENQTPSKPRHLELSGLPVAVSGRGKSAHVLVREGAGVYVLVGFDRRGRSTWSEAVSVEDEPVAVGRDVPLPAMVELRMKSRVRLFFVDAAESLFEVVYGEDSSRMVRRMDAVALVGRTEVEPWVVQRSREDGEALVVHHSAGNEFRSLSGPIGVFPHEGGPHPAVAEGRLAGGLDRAFVFRSADQGRWHLHGSAKPTASWSVRPGSQVVGAVLALGRSSRGLRGTAYLLQLRRQGWEVALDLEDGASAAVAGLPARALKASLPAGGRPVVLLEFEGGLMQVRSLPGLRVLMEVRP